jgi:drug/metabolite transporter (DMT)-like permease
LNPSEAIASAQGLLLLSNKPILTINYYTRSSPISIMWLRYCPRAYNFIRYNNRMQFPENTPNQALIQEAAGVRASGDSKNFLPYICLAGGVVALSLSAIFIREADAPTTVTTFYRMTFASFFLLPFFIRSARRENWHNNLRWLPLAILGGLFTAFDHGSWSLALEKTNVANATLFNNIAPVWVALVAFFIWKDRLKGRFWLGLAFTMCGASFILGSQLFSNQGFNAGDIWGVVSSFFYAGYFLVTQRVRCHFRTMTYIWLVAFTASIVLLGFNLAVQRPLSGFTPATYMLFVAAALISQIGGYFSVAYALGHLPAAVVAPTMILQPVMTALLAIPLAGEPLSPTQMIGGAGVLLGIYLINR